MIVPVLFYRSNRRMRGKKQLTTDSPTHKNRDEQKLFVRMVELVELLARAAAERDFAQLPNGKRWMDPKERRN